MESEVISVGVRARLRISDDLKTGFGSGEAEHREGDRIGGLLAFLVEKMWFADDALIRLG